MLDKKDRTDAESTPNVNRRSFLAVAGSGVIASTGGIALLRQGNAMGIEDALQIRNRRGLSNSAFRDLLRENGFSLSTSDGVRVLPTGGAPAPGSDYSYEINKSTWEYNLTLVCKSTYDCSEKAIDFEWQFDRDDDQVPAGEEPNDLAALEWESDDYDFVRMYTGNYVEENSQGDAKGPAGISGEYGDYTHKVDKRTSEDYPYSPMGSYITAQVEPDGEEPDETQVGYDYYHTTTDEYWDVDIGADWPPVSVTLESEEEWAWTIEDVDNLDST